jgi:hypothetical protein
LQTPNNFLSANLNPSLYGRGVDWALPPEIQFYPVSVAAIAANTKEPEVAKSAIKFLTAPPAIAVFKAKGLNPV